MPPDRPGGHTVVADAPALLDALAAPFGTYVGVASCRPVPGTRSVEALSVDLLCALGKTQALTQKAGTGTPWPRGGCGPTNWPACSYSARMAFAHRCGMACASSAIGSASTSSS